VRWARDEGENVVVISCRPVIRRLFTAASAISLLLCVASTIAAARGNHPFIYRRLMHTEKIVGPPIGGQAIPLKGPISKEYGDWAAKYDNPKSGQVLGFQWSVQPLISWPMNLGPVVKRGDVFTLECPVNPLAFGFAALPFFWACGKWKRRLISGHCAGCGYDLRASTGRCPECGTPIPSQADRAY
jgi:hypothetical protein